MKWILPFIALSFSEALVADSCSILYDAGPSVRMSLRLSYAEGLKIDDVKELTKNVRSHLKLNKISYENWNTDEGRFIRILEGDGSSPIERMAKFLERNYETKLVVDPTITSKSDFLGYFTYIDDEPAIALRPEDLIHLGRDDYATLMHEARHARYNYLKRSNQESIFHSEFIARGENNFVLAGERTTAYTDYMNFEEIPLHATDFQREVYFYGQLGPLEKAQRLPRLKADFERLRALNERSRVWINRVKVELNEANWKDSFRAGLDDYELYLKFTVDDVDFSATFVKPNTLKKLIKLDDDRIEQVARDLLFERVNKVQIFLGEMDIRIKNIQKIFERYDRRFLTHEEFAKEIGAEYREMKKLINLESSL